MDEIAQHATPSSSAQQHTLLSANQTVHQQVNQNLTHFTSGQNPPPQSISQKTNDTYIDKNIPHTYNNHTHFDNPEESFSLISHQKQSAQNSWTELDPKRRNTVTQENPIPLKTDFNFSRTLPKRIPHQNLTPKEKFHPLS